MLEGKEIKNTKGNKKVDYNKINDILHLFHNALKIFYILLFIVCGYLLIKVCQDLNISKFLLDILSILAPLFIGLVIAWLFNPFVIFLQKHKIKRVFGVVISYILLLGVLTLVIGSICPILYDQIISFAETVPNLVNELETGLDGFLDRFSNIDGVNIESVKDSLMIQLDTFATNLSESLPTMVIDFIKGLISGISTFGIGLVIGFFFLLSFDNVGDNLSSFIPTRWRKDVVALVTNIDRSLRQYVSGVLIDGAIVFTICSITFSAIGLRAPLLFALFCAITNVIPYIGPYIGAVPALIVGFSMSPTIGLLTLIAIVIIQFIEGNFLQEYIISKTTKMHPVSIIIGLLIFGHFWGMFGMIISTPVLAVLKTIWQFLDEKNNFFGFREDEVCE